MFYKLNTGVLIFICSRFIPRVLLNLSQLHGLKISILYYSVVYNLLTSALYL